MDGQVGDLSARMEATNLVEDGRVDQPKGREQVSELPLFASIPDQSAERTIRLLSAHENHKFDGYSDDDSEYDIFKVSKIRSTRKKPAGMAPLELL
jgi:hypothetical protein